MKTGKTIRPAPGKRLSELIASAPYSLSVLPQEFVAIGLFLFNRSLQKYTFFQKFSLLVRFYQVSLLVHCLHRQSEMLQVASAILSSPSDLGGCVVEAGSYKGGSAAKLSLACKLAQREMVVFDSFAGFPEDAGFQPEFSKQNLCGSLAEVKNNIARFGCIDSCQFVEGWFKDTLPNFKRKISVIYLDVDLASSTKVCLSYLYPLLEEKGTLFSHDGDFAPVIDVFDDDRFWKNEVGFKKPLIIGLKKEKLIKIMKALK